MQETAEIVQQSEINIVEIVKETVNSLCNSLFDSINNTVFPMLDDIVFLDDSIISSSNTKNLFSSSLSNGILILANCLLVAFILYYSVRLLISNFSGSNIDSPFKFFLKAIFISILMNFSFDLCISLLNINFDITSYFCILGEDLFDNKISFISFTNELRSNLNGNSDIFSLTGILESTLYISSFSLVINFSLRYVFIKVLVLLSPFAFLCLLNKPTENLFKSWFKSFFCLLFLQVVVSIILLLSFSLATETSNPLFNNILLIGSISALLKANQFIKELIGGLDLNSNIQSSLSGLKYMFSK